ncbi:helix-turn-helix domain-containing protein [Mesorhizobium sp.]|uniref:helix-turn-helix domain-containing protein n=1 Tax=Mesorhizobium sp. TaxID=1871066 RepID=UPI00268F100E
MKPYLEKVTVADDASWSMVRVPRDPTIPFEWHHHPEYELTLTLNSRGCRFVGDHVGGYDDGDLVLLGPNLPHTWSSTSKLDGGKPHLVMVIWFRPEWARGLTGLLTELRPVAGLLQRSARGLKFSQAATGRVRARIEAIFDKPPADRLLDLIAVLLALAEDDAAEPLTAPSRSPQSTLASSGARIDRVLGHLHTHYTDELRIDRVARLAALSPSGFHRMFTRHTRLTVTEYVTRLRIGKACALLTEGDKQIAHIAEQVGYRSLANFGRHSRL